MGELAGGALAAGSNIGGAFISANAQDQATQANIAFQTELAQQGIQWKVADAKAAGINPIYALGAPTYSPAEVIPANENVGKGVQAAGQDISRAVAATMSPSDRMKKDAVDSANLEHAKLSNDLLKVQIHNAASNQPLNPPLPTDKGMEDVIRRWRSAPDRASAVDASWDFGARARGYSDWKAQLQASHDIHPSFWDDIQHVSMSDISRRLSDIYHASRLYHWYSGQ